MAREVKVMKAYFMKAALLTLLAGFTVSAGAKPGEMTSWQGAQSASRQSSSMVVAAGVATTATSGLSDQPISLATPRRRR